jgi:hypothetical protein
VTTTAARTPPVSVHAPADRETARGPVARWSGWIVAFAALVSSVTILHATRETSFFLDEWWFAAHRRELSVHNLLLPHFGHLVALPVAAYQVMFEVFGLRSYVPYVVLLVLLHVTACVLLFTYLRRRAPAIYAVVATIVMLLLGRSWENLIWPFQIAYELSVVGGLASLLLLDRRDRRGDVGALVVLVASIASSGVGLVFACGAVLELAWRKDDWRRVWVPLVPIAMFGLWHLREAERSQGGLGNFTEIGPFVTTLAGDTGHALLGLGGGLGLVAISTLLVVAVARAAQTWPITGRLASCIAMPLGLWGLLIYARGGDELGNRYVYPSAVFVVLLGGELLASIPSRGRRRLGVIAPAMVILAGVVALAANLSAFGEGGAVRRAAATDRITAFSALEHSGARANREALVWWIYPDSPRVGEVLDAIESFEYPVLSADEIRTQPARARREADLLLFGALSNVDVPPDAVTGGAVTAAVPFNGSLTADGACRTFVADDAGGDVVLQADRMNIHLEVLGDEPVHTAMRSIGDEFIDLPPFRLEPGMAIDLSLASTGLAPWTLRFTTEGSIRACPIA